MGGNDYHMTDDGTINPTLGRDEPTAEQKAGIRSAGAARMQRMKDELKAQSAELTEKERKLLEQGKVQLAKEQELEKRERELAKRERDAAKKGGAKPKSPTHGAIEPGADEEDEPGGGQTDPDRGE